LASGLKKYMDLVNNRALPMRDLSETDIERMARDLGLQLCSFTGECDTCHPELETRAWVLMYQPAESNPEVMYYACDHCVPKRHQEAKARNFECIL
jgi:hypothetical protein